MLVGRYKAGLSQWLWLLLLIPITGWTTCVYFPRTSYRATERSCGALMCFLSMRSWVWAPALKPYCLNTRSDTSCDCLQRVGGRGRGRDRGSLKRRALAAVKQRAWVKPYHQRGPCVLRFWTNTVGPPSGWVPQPGSLWPEREMRQEIIFHLCETSGKQQQQKKTVLLF